MDFTAIVDTGTIFNFRLFLKTAKSKKKESTGQVELSKNIRIYC